MIENGSANESTHTSNRYDIIQYNKRKLYEMIEYVENNIDCRRKLTLNYFNEEFDESTCNSTCDNCKHNAATTTIKINVTSYIISLLNIIKSLHQSNVETKVNLVLDIFKGLKTKNSEHYTTHSEYGAIKHNIVDKRYTLNHNDAQRILHYCITNNIIDEHSTTVKNS